MFITDLEFTSALKMAKQLLKANSLFTRRMRQTKVKFSLFFLDFYCHGLADCSKTSNTIYIPRISLAYYYDKKDLVATLLHEYAHVYLWLYPEIETRWLDLTKKSAYGQYDPEEHITQYAHLDEEEDFCEVFATYCKTQVRPSKYSGILRRKFKFMQGVCRGQFTAKSSAARLAQSTGRSSSVGKRSANRQRVDRF